MTLLSDKLQNRKALWFDTLSASTSLPGRPGRVWIGILVAGVFLLVVSIAGLYLALRMPASHTVTTPLARYTHEGQFFYTVELQPTSFFDESELGPGRVYLTRLVKTARMRYTYQFRVDQPIQRAEFVYHAFARFGFPNTWEKHLVLVPPTKGEAQDTFSFVVSIADLVEMLDTFRRETGINPGSPQLTIIVRIDPVVETEPGLITEPFEHTLAFRFEGEMMIPDGDLTARREGAITRTTTVQNSRRTAQLVFSVIGILVSVCALLAAGWWYDQIQKNRPWVEQELERARKLAGRLLVRVAAIPPLNEATASVVDVYSLEDLIQLAEETLRPVLCVVEKDRVTYCVLDGSSSICYCFVSRQEKPSSSSF